MQVEKIDECFKVTLENLAEEAMVKHSLYFRSQGKTIFDVAANPEGLKEMVRAKGHDPVVVKQQILDEDERVVKVFTGMMEGEPISQPDFALLVHETNSTGVMRCGGWAVWGRTTKRGVRQTLGRDKCGKDATKSMIQRSQRHHMMMDALRFVEELGISMGQMKLEKLCWFVTEGEGKPIEPEDREDLFSREEVIEAGA